MSDLDVLIYLAVGEPEAIPFAASTLESVFTPFAGPPTLRSDQTRSFGDSGEVKVNLFVSETGRPGAFVRFVRPLLEQKAAEGLEDLLLHMSRALGVSFGRTTTLSALSLAPGADEWEGQVTMVDWFQYFGPLRVGAWSAQYLRAGPFHRVEVYSDGAVGLFAAASPFARIPRTKVAEYLGITLRDPGTIRNPSTGLPMIVPWD